MTSSSTVNSFDISKLSATIVEVLMLIHNENLDTAYNAVKHEDYETAEEAIYKVLRGFNRDSIEHLISTFNSNYVVKIDAISRFKSYLAANGNTLESNGDIVYAAECGHDHWIYVTKDITNKNTVSKKSKSKPENWVVYNVLGGHIVKEKPLYIGSKSNAIAFSKGAEAVLES